jgi:hypothetical protein
MFWQKSCPRCKGDLYQDSDVYGIYVACFQYSHYLPVIKERNNDGYFTKPKPKQA